ncbi:MAG: response regulator [Clostridia bacterium]|nr:response regulator [Clostridia bacterium]
MYNLIIADDEASIRDGISKLIKLVFPDLNIQKICSNGKEVIEAINLGMTDILIIDINMPVCTGLDVAKYIYENKLDIRIIMITGYAKFEYAKDAVNYKVDRFLTKPFESETLINVVKECIGSLESKSSFISRQTESFLQNHAKNKDLLTLGYTGVINIDSLDKHRIFFREKGLEELFICELSFFFDAPFDTSEISANLCGFGEFSCNEFESYLINTNANGFIFAVILSEEKPEIPEGIAKEIAHSFLIFYDINVKYDIGSLLKFEKWIFNCKENSILDSYIAKLRDKRFAHAFEEINEYFLRLSENSRPEFIKALTSKISQGFKIYSQIPSEQESEKNLAFLHKNIVSELSKSYDIIQQIKNFVNENYDKSNISLYNISSELHMNETYLSRIFKEKTGEKFVDFLIKVRVENAKRLLSTGKYTVTEVAHMVGYSQTKYFRTVFKKITGVTASEFIKRSVLGGYDI